MLMGLAVAFNAAQAEEHTHEEGYEFSVFQNYRHLQMVNVNAVLETQDIVAANFPGWNADIDKLNSKFSDMYGPALTVPGGTHVEKANGLLAGKLTKLGLKANEWKLVRNKDAGHAWYVDYIREVGGHEVMFSKLSFRFAANGSLTRITLRTYGEVEQGITPTIAPQNALKDVTKELSGTSITSKTVDNDWLWFPVPTTKGYVMRPAYKYVVTGEGEVLPYELEGYVDAISGDLLYRMNYVHQTIDVKAQASVYKTKPSVAATTEPLAHLRVTIGGTNYETDENGDLNIPSLNAPQNATVTLRGAWSRIRQGAGNGPTPSVSTTFSNATNTFTYTTSGSANSADLNAFYHANRVHDFMKGYMPSFTGMDFSLNTVTDRTNSSCNAYYNGSSINFYAAAGNCRSFAEVGDIVYHEYGHGINREYYRDNGSPAGMTNGSLNEGYADVWSMAINKDGVVGEDAFISGGNIRSYVGAPKVYPQDIEGEVHADGEIIAGAWWDVAVNIGSEDTMTQIFVKTYPAVHDGPLGTEGKIYHEILITALQADDDDNNLSNGTPHFKQIAEAFARHGIYLMSDATLSHNELAHQAPGSAIDVNTSMTLVNPAFFQELKLIYRERGQAWDTVTMANTSGNNYSGQIPSQAAGTVIDYYFAIFDFLNTSVYTVPDRFSPDAALSQEVTLPYQFAVGVNVRKKVDFETNASDWQLGISTDNATSGTWIQASPISSSYGSIQVQTGSDNTTGSGQCMITGNAGSQFISASVADVDRGRTTLQTPVFDLSGYYDPIIEYYRYYSNDVATSSPSNIRSDYWQVQINNTLGVIWRNVELTYQSDHKWRRKVFKLSEYYPGSTKVQMRFIASDNVIAASNDGQNLVEAAVDDFFIYDGAPTSIANSPEQLRAEVYPNPADEQVKVTIPVSGNGSLQLVDLAGRVLAQQAVKEGTSVYTISTANIASGTYMVLIQTDKAIQNTKVVVKH